MNTVLTKKRRILVIEDDPVTAGRVRMILRPSADGISHPWSEGKGRFINQQFPTDDIQRFDVDCVDHEGNGREVVKQALSEGYPVAVLFLDVRAQDGRDSFETVRCIWEEDSELQVVICTADPSLDYGEVLERLERPDQVVILRKPFQPFEVWNVSVVLTMKWYWAHQALIHTRDLEEVGPICDKQLEEPNRWLENDLIRRQAVEGQLAQVVRDLEERNVELSAVRDQALNEIQERERIETVLRRQTDALARSNKDLEQFASIAAHDLQEPLHSIQVFVDLLRVKYEEVLDATGRGYLDRVKKAAGRMHQMIQGLLIYSKVDSLSSLDEQLSLRNVVEDILCDFGARITELQAVVHTGDLPTIRVNACQIRQLLQNLIGNALKFHRPGIPPVIHISGTIIQERRHSGLGTPGVLCQLEIQDEGIGIPPEQLDKIFMMFKRLHRKDEYEGTGIGLAVCKRIVDQCGGAIAVRSRPGEGSTFIVTIPTKS